MMAPQRCFTNYVMFLLVHYISSHLFSLCDGAPRVQCVSLESDPSNDQTISGTMKRATVTCDGTNYPTMLSCGFQTYLDSQTESRGNTIRYIPGQTDPGDPQRCTAEYATNSAGKEAYAYAQCCKFPDSTTVTCDHHRNDAGGPQTGDDSINDGDCSGSLFPTAKLFGCSLHNDDGAGSEGTYPFASTAEFVSLAPATISASLSECTSETGDIGSSSQAVYSEMQCCTITSNDILNCDYVVRKATVGTVSASCNNADQFIAACSGWINPPTTSATTIVKYEIHDIFSIYICISINSVCVVFYIK